jgi:hypothetical protein
MAVATNLRGISFPGQASKGPIESVRVAPAVTSVNNVPAKSGLTFYISKRRLEMAAQGQELKTAAAMKEWKELPVEERKRFEDEALARRKAADVDALSETCRLEAENANAGLLQKFREQAHQQLTSRPIAKVDRIAASVKRQRKETSDYPEQLRRPVFPERRDMQSLSARTGRRQGTLEAMKVHTENGGASVSVCSSHRISLADVSARLNAPTLSCDWQRGNSDEEESEEGMLEVDIPEETKARDLMDLELQRKISSAQVKRLMHET